MEQFVKLISHLMHSRTQTHVFHLQTNSYAEHVALGAYYDGIVGLVDGLVESYQGKYGILEGYQSYNVIQYSGKATVIGYLKALLSIISSTRSAIQDSYIQNQIDTVEELVTSTLYKLRFLS